MLGMGDVEDLGTGHGRLFRDQYTRTAVNLFLSDTLSTFAPAGEELSEGVQAMLSKRSIEVLLDLAENKLSDIVPFDREDMREMSTPE
jgi:hypothetical protein